MARIRTIKPEFPQSESIGKLSRDARLLFIQIWTIVDDSGRTRASSRMLASLLYPYDDDVPSLMDGWLAELEKGEQIRRYAVDGCSYLEVCNWLKHQKIDKPSASRLPEFVEGSRILAEPSRTLAPDLVPSTKDLVPSIEPPAPTVPVPPSPPEKPKEKFVLPAWIITESWEGFVEMRKKIKKPLTDHAMTLAVRELEKLRAQGESAEAVLNQAILRCHQGLFPVSKNGNGLFSQPEARKIQVTLPRSAQVTK